MMNSDEHAETMRKVVTYANDESKATEHSVGKGQAYGLSRGIALNLVRYCCNARDVHFLRALPLGVVGAAVNAHDAGIQHAVAGVLAQVAFC